MCQVTSFTEFDLRFVPDKDKRRSGFSGTRRIGPLSKQLGEFEGAHLDEIVKCNACNVYHHHNHTKTEWRGEQSQGGFDEDAT